MGASFLAGAAGLLVLFSSSTSVASADELKWPSCELRPNWYFCRGSTGSAIICDMSVLRDTKEPFVVRWTPPDGSSLHSSSSSELDFDFMYRSVVNEGIVTSTIKFCSKDGSPFVRRDGWDVEDSQCKTNWYHCEQVGKKTNCRLKLCPWSNTPMIPKTKKHYDWHDCTRNGATIECRLSIISVRNPTIHYGERRVDKNIATSELQPKLDSVHVGHYGSGAIIRK